MKKPYYFYANSYEGCGHRHRTKNAAKRCQRFFTFGRVYKWLNGKGVKV